MPEKQPEYERLDITEANRALVTDIEGRDFAMCIDGRIVTRTHDVGFFTRDGVPVVRVAFEASLDECIHADHGLPMIKYYKGFNSGDLADIKVPGQPRSGNVHVVGFIQSDQIGVEPKARVLAISRIYDWEHSKDWAARGETFDVDFSVLCKSMTDPVMAAGAPRP